MKNVRNLFRYGATWRCACNSSTVHAGCGVGREDDPWVRAVMYHIAAYQNSIGEQPSGPEEEILSPSSNHRRNQLSGRPFPQTGVRSHWFYKCFLKWDSFFIRHCFISRPSDSTVSGDAGIEPRTVATSALAVRRFNNLTRSNPQLG